MSYKQIEQETKMIISNKNNESSKTESENTDGAYINCYDMTDSDSLEILKPPRGMKYSILKDIPDGISEYVLYSGEEPPALYSAGLPDTVRKLRVMLDEYLDDDISEILHFFKSPELYNKYKCLEIMVRSYTDPEKINYSDGCIPRFYRINEPEKKIKFSGSIHESISLKYPLGYFSTILHHTGYCFSSDTQKYEKANRNMKLLREEHCKNPDDLRTLSQLIDGTTTFLLKEREIYAKKALEVIRKSSNRDIYTNVLYVQIIDTFKTSQPEYALQICDEYFKGLEDNEKYVATIGVLVLKAEILNGLSRYEESCETYDQYFKLYNDYKSGKMDITDMSAHGIVGLSDFEYSKIVYSAAICLKILFRYNEAFKLLEQFDVSEIWGEQYRNHLGTLRLICQDMKNYSMMASCYEKVNKLDDASKKSLALYMLESTYYSLFSENERKQFAKDLILSGAHGQYIELMKLVLSQNEKDFIEKLIVFFEQVDNWDDGYSEAIYLAIKYKLDISKYIMKMKASLFREKLEEISIYHDDFAYLVLEYNIHDCYYQSIKQFYWLVSLYEKASYRTFKLNDNQKYSLYNMFFDLLSDYVLNIYNPELLNDSDIDVLPILHKFGYYMSKANQSKRNGAYVDYIKNMKNALISCESMKEIVQFMLEYFRKENNL